MELPSPTRTGVVGRWTRLTLALATALVASCRDGTTEVTGLSEDGSRVEEFTQGGLNEFESESRVLLDVNASGTWRPGEPVVISVVGTARKLADDVDFSLLLQDEEGAFVLREAQPPRVLASSRRPLGAGASFVSRAVLSFAAPGYYRVLARAENHPRSSEPPDPTGIETRELAERTIWLLVDETGGRLTDGYDRSAIPSGVRPLHGSYGPFVPLRRPRASGKVGAASGAASLYGGASLGGYFRYGNHDLAGVPLDPVPGAEVQAFCHGKSDPLMDEYDLVYSVQTTTSANGGFGVECDAGYEYISGEISLRGTYAYVAGKNNEYAGAAFAGYDGELLELRAANDYAARVFLDLRERVPQVFQKFGRTRARMDAEVADHDESFGIRYCATAGGGCSRPDYIQSNQSRVFGTREPHDGRFVTMHEFAHAYHYQAVESPSQNGCTPPYHSWDETENLGCAFAEGFADFLAMYIVGSTVFISPYAGDYGLENNVYPYPATPTNPPLGGDGMRVEAAVASFLYDLIDTGGELDGPTNGVGPAESFDSLSVPGPWLLDVMQHCRLNGSALQLSGADQLVYCLEGSTSAYAVSLTYSTAWRSCGSVSFSPAVPAYPANQIRTLWRQNFYGAP